jgi:N,N'-diacetyllegionaminate synthase
MKTFDNDIHIIAEAGTNNNGFLSKAKNLSDIAKRSGASSIKFQIINTWGLYLPGKYEYGKYNIEDVIKIRQDGEMTDAEYEELSDYCNKIDIPFSASVFDKQGLNLLAKLDTPYIKLASCDLNNLRFQREACSLNKKIILSTGMSTLKDVEKSIKNIEKTGFKELVLLHCVSVYPSQLELCNLSFINTLKSEFGYEVGFSDHTGSSTAACMALALGATWFEKHFTEDKNQKGLDHAYALDEIELKSYVHDLKSAWTAMQPKQDKISEAEFNTRKRARRSLYAKKDLPVGHILTNDDVLCVRPENIMQADEIDDLIGKKLIKEIKQLDPFSFKIVE